MVGWKAICGSTATASRRQFVVCVSRASHLSVDKRYREGVTLGEGRLIDVVLFGFVILLLVRLPTMFCRSEVCSPAEVTEFDSCDRWLDGRAAEGNNDHVFSIGNMMMFCRRPSLH